MKKIISKISAVLLAIIICMTVILPSENIMAGNNVTINFTDPVLYEIVLKELNEDDDITVISSDDNNKSIVLSQTDINKITSLDLNYFDSTSDNKVITNLTGLEKFTELTSLDIYNTGINTGEAKEGSFSDLSPLEGLTKLRYLDLAGCLAEDLSSISGLTNLNSLYIEGAKGIDISEIENLTNLTYLSLMTCDLESDDLVHIAKLTNLTELILGGPNYEDNNITDITELKKLTNLKYLRLSNNQITDITPLANLKNLKELSLRCNPITDITPLGGLTELRTLELGRIGYGGSSEGVPIEGKIDVLKNLTNLYSLKLSHCGITDISALANLNNLSVLDLTCNSIMDFSPIENNGISYPDLSEQLYEYTVEAGQTFVLPQVCLDAMYDTSAYVYTADTKISGDGFTVAEDGKSVVIDEGITEAYLYVGRTSSDDDYSATIAFNVIDTKSPIIEVSYSDENLTKEDVTVTIKANEDIQSIEGFTKVDSKTYTKKYSSNSIESIDVYDLAGNKSVANINITNIDKTAPVVEVEYSPTEATKENVTVTIKANEEIQSIEGFTKVDSKTYTKKYSSNITESIDVYDLAGNKSVANINITNIDKTAPVVEVEYSVTETTKEDVTVTIKANEEIQSIEGFTKVDSKTYTKEYDVNEEEAVDVFDLAGNKSVANINITNIDKTAPVVEVEYSITETTKENVIVTIKANEEIQSIEGFTKVDSKTYTKEYEVNKEEAVDVYDFAGNKAVANINITNIDKTAPIAEVEYSTVEDTYENVEVTIKANEEIQSIEGFTKVDSKTYTKKYEKNATESIDVIDLVGNKTVVEVSVTNIKDKPVVEDKKEPETEEVKEETETTKKEEPKKETEKKETPKTGDNSMNTIFAVLLMISAGVVVVLKSKKVENK